MPGGRPSDYTSELAEEICARIANGQSIREIERTDGMPAMSTIFRWLAKFPEFQEQYARAREAQAEHLAEDILDIADNGTNDWMERQRETKGVRFVENAEAINRSRLRVDARKWLLSKLLPKKYGDKLEHAGKVDGAFTFTWQPPEP